jgi:integrase
VVTLGGRDVYLGKWNSKASRAEYDRFIGEWLAGGRCRPMTDDGVTVAELALGYWRHAKTYYVKNGKPSGWQAHIRLMLRIVRQSYGHTPAADFGPLALKALRQKLIDAGHSRGYINKLIGIVKRMFKWAVAEELVPANVYHGLSAVEGLRKGRTTAREPDPITPVPEDVVQTTLPHLPEIVSDMVRFQRLTGCRPAEVCMVRPCDVDSSGDVWFYRPESHKTEHHGRERIICVGPKAQDVLRPYLLRPAEAFCFSPVESVKKQRAERHAKRRTPLSCGNRPGTNRKRSPKRKAGDRYDSNSYRKAVHRAIDQANRERVKEAKQNGVAERDVELLPRWSPNRLRHSAATEIRKRFGLEAAQVALGHAAADVTQVYAERDLKLAAEVMRKIG